MLQYTDLVMCLSEFRLTPVTLQECSGEKKDHTPTDIDSSAYVVDHRCSANEISFVQTQPKARFGIFQTRPQFFPNPLAVLVVVRHEGIELLQWNHDDVIKWKHFPRYWPFVWGIHRSPVNSPHKGQRRRAMMFSLICAWINGLVNNREAGDLKSHRVHYDVMEILLAIHVFPHY